MIPDFIPDDTPKAYNNYGVPPSVPFDVNNVTIGPIDTNDPSEGLHFKYWSAYVDGSNDLILEDIGISTTVILNEPDEIVNVALAFDQNANDTYAWITGLGELKLRWFDASVPADVVVSFGQAQSVTLTMDMKYFPSSPESDILLFYIRNNAIYFRAQRDKFAIEHSTPVASGANRLIDSGMRTDYRFQVRWS